MNIFIYLNGKVGYNFLLLLFYFLFFSLNDCISDLFIFYLIILYYLHISSVCDILSCFEHFLKTFIFFINFINVKSKLNTKKFKNNSNIYL